MEPDVLPNHPDTYQPANMTSALWQVVILVLWSNLKADLNLVDEMVYLQGLAARGIELPKAFGHNLKQKTQPDAKTSQDNRNKPAVPRKAKPQAAKTRSPRSDSGDALCFADLLNHYGSNQQIACEVPCKYPHYNAIAKGVTKAAVINKVQFLASRLQLAEGTVGFLKKRIEADTKFK
jgi:hypothetical protein